MKCRSAFVVAAMSISVVSFAADQPGAKPEKPAAEKPAADKAAAKPPAAKPAKPPRPQDETFLDAALAGDDYKIQGEYALQSDGRGKVAAQVVALGGGTFEVYFLSGGLPGAGYDKQSRVKVLAKTIEGKTTFEGEGYRGEIGGGVLSVTTPKDESLKLSRVERSSPTLGAKPPQGATVLFDGTNADAWKEGTLTDEKLLAVGTSSKEAFSNFRLHLEFRTPYKPKARGQGRGNSGVYVGGREVQVLDSFGLDGSINECGALYSQKIPDVNMCLPPLVWQTYDIDYTASADGKGVVMTVLHNGEKIHDAVPVKAKQPAGILLQNHGNPVAFRNIWVAPLEKK